MKSSSNSYLLGLDHLRAFAALLVFFYHAIHSYGIGLDYVPTFPLSSLFEEGYVGVQLFICITGFVFTVLVQDREVDYFKFLKNRFLRVFPLTFLMTLFVVSIGDAGGDTLFLMFNPLGAGGVAGTWTVILEFQFYLAYPFLKRTLFVSSLRATAMQCGLMIGLFILLRCCAYAIHGTVEHLAYWTMIGEADCFFFGILGGAIFLRARTAEPRRIMPVAWAVLLGSALILIATEHWFNVTGGYAFRPADPSPSRLWLLRPTELGLLFTAIIVSYCLVSASWTHRLSRLLA